MANINWHATPNATEPFISGAGQIDFDLVVYTVSDKRVLDYYHEPLLRLSVFVKIQFRESAMQANQLHRYSRIPDAFFQSWTFCNRTWQVKRFHIEVENKQQRRTANNFHVVYPVLNNLVRARYARCTHLKGSTLWWRHHRTVDILADNRFEHISLFRAHKLYLFSIHMFHAISLRCMIFVSINAKPSSTEIFNQHHVIIHNDNSESRGGDVENVSNRYMHRLSRVCVCARCVRMSMSTTSTIRTNMSCCTQILTMITHLHFIDNTTREGEGGRSERARTWVRACMVTELKWNRPDTRATRQITASVTVGAVRILRPAFFVFQAWIK